MPQKASRQAGAADETPERLPDARYQPLDMGGNSNISYSPGGDGVQHQGAVLLPERKSCRSDRGASAAGAWAEEPW